MRWQIRDRFEPVAVVEAIPPVRRRDWAITAMVALASIAFITFDDMLPIWANIIPAAVSVAFVPFRRQVPLAAVTTMAVVSTGCVVLALRGPDIVTDVGSPAGVADIVLFYALCRWSTPTRIGIGFVAAIAAEGTILWAAGTLDFGAWVLVFPWLILAAFALAMRYRARVTAIRIEQVRLTERNALARELHDTVAHHVSAIAVQAQAGQFVVDSNPAAAAGALHSIEAIANQSIDEMRRMVGILRSPADVHRTVAPDSLDVLATRDTSPAVHIRGDTRIDELPAGVGAALFRIAQESITNARTHSRDVTYVEVAVERHAERVDMTIDNDGTPTTRNSGSGYGMVGMRERVDALGGTFASGPRPADGWRTTTSIPLERTSQ